MASYDQLPAQQRAVVDLVLKRGQSYEQLADTLDMSPRRVRELAREALVALAPVSAGEVDPDEREAIADYLLNQQSPTEAAATRGRLRRSEGARAWARSVVDSLEHLYSNGSLPAIPAGGPSVDETPSRPAPAPGATREVVRRRRIAGAGALAALLLLALLIWPIGLLTGDDDGRSRSRPMVLGQMQLRPVGGASDDQAGIAVLWRRADGTLELSIEARLRRSRRDDAYQVWLYNSREDARSLGAQVANAQGVFAGRAPVPEDYEDYRFLDISREQIRGEAGHSGESVLRGRVSQLSARGGR